MEKAMFGARTRILAGIALIGSTAALVPEAAIADGICSSGAVAAGGVQSFNYNLDSSLRAQFTLDTAATDVAMQIVDNSNNVACQTALPNPGHQSCSWTPIGGVTYTVNVLRPVAQQAADPAASAPVESISTNIGQGADTSGDDIQGSWHHEGDGAGHGDGDRGGDGTGDQASNGGDNGGNSDNTDQGNSPSVPPTPTNSASAGPSADFTLCYLQVN